RSGGLEQAVAVTRYRNLTLSAAVLMLLAAALAALTVATRRAERLARRQMEFVAGVSHELRTPLSVIGAAAGNLADGVVAAPPQVRQYGALIQSEGRRLTAMVEQILRYADIRSGRVEPPPRPAELEPILQAAVQACSAELRENQVALDLRLEPGLPPVPADSAALTHCLRNLIANAALHGGAGGRIELVAARRDGQVQITVSDRGRGFAAEDLPHLFEPFYRGRAALDAQTRGFGLGLTLARRIAESHGGTLTAENRTSGGARFLLTLPTCSQEAS
ncbi:MAG: HAMP domain-containing sensor histidine kinase, partial [Bryobacterales bacterium]|nr:HAMP domain-containing sensor histidine kinase [Bryobacterales bacterium]